ncbi:MAG: LacI family transcriptional regulator [Actinobacteria bacterium HGW-Actinobacteria-4]|nr:MAG: LacI family transcriptional regulator [Actinobacteria bacterium HGW-Actinobacteria-4]
MGTSRRPTMADVAAKAGVSLSTVSLTYSGAGPISPDMKARVEKAALALGYAGPSPQGRALRSGRSHIVGVVIHEKLHLAFRDPLALRVIDALIEDLGDMGLGVLLIPSPSGEPGERSLLDSAPMDAAVVIRVRDHDEPALEILKRRGVPIVVMEGPAPLGAGSVTIDDTSATVELIEHLMELGHEHIATVTLPLAINRETHVLGPETDVDAVWTPTHNRLVAFERAGIEPCVVVEARASMVEEGIAAGHLALSHESKPTAIVCQSDLLAGGVILAARELELRVPQDISVTGFDGLDLPWIAPHEITSMSQDGSAKGHALASEVKALLAGESPAPITMPLEFRPGNTTAKPGRR